MTSPSSLTPEQLAEFDRRGVLRLPGLLSPDRVRRAREYVQGRLARLGVRPRPQWPATGLKASKDIGNKHPDVEALLDEPALLAAVDALLEGGAFDRELFKRPQLLVSLPNADVWTMPTGWHADAPRLASNRRPGVQLFTCLDLMEPGGGATMVLAGSHRLFNEGRVIAAKELRGLLRRDEFFRRLYAGTGEREGTVGDMPLEVIECVGAPGDAYLVDMRVLHAASPNASARPRIMATHRFWCADLVPELAQAFGWEDAPSA